MRPRSLAAIVAILVSTAGMSHAEAAGRGEPVPPTGVPQEVLSYVASFDGLSRASIKKEHPDVGKMAASKETRDALWRWLKTPSAQDKRMAGLVAGVLRLGGATTTSNIEIVRPFLHHSRADVRLEAYTCMIRAFFTAKERKGEMVVLLQEMFSDTSALVSRNAITWMRAAIKAADARRELEPMLQQWYKNATPADKKTERYELVGQLLADLRAGKLQGASVPAKAVSKADRETSLPTPSRSPVASDKPSPKASPSPAASTDKPSAKASPTPSSAKPSRIATSKPDIGGEKKKPSVGGKKKQRRKSRRSSSAGGSSWPLALAIGAGVLLLGFGAAALIVRRQPVRQTGRRRRA